MFNDAMHCKHVLPPRSKVIVRMGFLLFVLFLVTCDLTDANCNYPEQWTTSSYYDSEKGPVTFSGNTMEGWQVTLTSIQKTIFSWECYQRNGSIIVSKSKEKITMYGISFYAFVCMVVDFKESHFFYKLWSAEEARADGERVKIKTQAQASLCEVCDKDFIPDASEIKYMCTLETCENVDASQYTEPTAACSDQPITTTKTTEETTTDQLSSSTNQSPPGVFETATTIDTTKQPPASRSVATTVTTTTPSSGSISTSTSMTTPTHQSSSGSISTSTSMTTSTHQSSSGSISTSTSMTTSTHQSSSGSISTSTSKMTVPSTHPSSGSILTSPSIRTSTHQPSSASKASTAITRATSTQPLSGSILTSTSMRISTHQSSSGSLDFTATTTTSTNQPSSESIDSSKAASTKPSTSYLSSRATSSHQSTFVNTKSSSSVAPKSSSPTISYTLTTSSVHISSVGFSTDNLLPETTSLNTSPKSSSESDRVPSTAKDPFKTLYTRADSVMTSLSTSNTARTTQISTIDSVSTNGIITPSRSNDKQNITDTLATDTLATTLGLFSISSTRNIPDKEKSSVPSLSAKSRPDGDILSIFTNEALVICAVLCVIILFVTLVSISIALKRKKSSARRRVLTHSSHIKPMYHGRLDFYYHP